MADTKDKPQKSNLIKSHTSKTSQNKKILSYMRLLKKLFEEY
jgi:hypothetical protein